MNKSINTKNVKKKIKNLTIIDFAFVDEQNWFATIKSTYKRSTDVK